MSVDPLLPGSTGGERAATLADVLREAAEAGLDPGAVLDVVVARCAQILGGEVSLQVVPADARAGAAEPDLPEADGEQIAVALRSRGRTLGAITLTRAPGGRPYTEADAAFAAELAARVAILYDNALRHQRVLRHASVLEQVDAPVVAVDRAGRITAWNPAAERLFGWSAAEAIGQDAARLVSAEPPEKLAHARAQVLETGSHGGEWSLRRRDGAQFPGYIRTVPARDEAGRVIGMVATYQDLTERDRLFGRMARQAAQQSAVAALGERALESDDPGQLLDHAVATIRDVLGVEITAMLELTPDRRRLVIRAGAGFADGVVRHATVPAGWHDSQEGFTLIGGGPVVVTDTAAEPRFAQAPLLAEHGMRSGGTVLIQGRGGPHGVLAAHAAQPGAFGPEDLAFLQAAANVLGDALDRWRGEEEIRRRGLHDPLTELPNRTLVLDRLAHALERADRQGDQPAHVALLFLDIDHFKIVNDSLGHRAGDELLCAVADRLRRAVRPADTIGRFGGDEFVVLCEDVRDEHMGLAIADRLAAVFARPFRIGGDEHQVGASIGLVLRTGSEDPEALLRDADAAMYRAKERGRGRVELFDSGMRAHAAGRLELEAALRRAVAAGEIEVHYQPIVELDGGETVALEALVRWRHPERGLLPPGEFLAVAEESGLVVTVGRHVLEHAARKAAAAGVRVHVNLSARQLLDPELVEGVEAALGAAGAAPGSLVFEIAEDALDDRTPGRGALLEQLRELGAGLLLDRFGTGSSSLAQLAGLPLDGVKIDRSFVAGVHLGHARVVDAIVRLAGALELDVVAVGIEDGAQLEALRRLGCRRGQGFLFAPPAGD